MKKRITIGTLTLLSFMGMFGCKQQETVEALMTLDVKADYPEKEWVVQDFLDVEYIPVGNERRVYHPRQCQGDRKAVRAGDESAQRWQYLRF